MKETIDLTLQQKACEAQSRLDEHVREMVRWHFSPETGCPFWLDFKERCGFDPIQEIGGYADLKLFGHFQDEWLRGGPVRRWLPTYSNPHPLEDFQQH